MVKTEQSVKEDFVRFIRQNLTSVRCGLPEDLWKACEANYERAGGE